jgi:hypothetical protein
MSYRFSDGVLQQLCVAVMLISYCGGLLLLFPDPFKFLFNKKQKAL